MGTRSRSTTRHEAPATSTSGSAPHPNAARVHRALAAFGAPLAELPPEDLAVPGVVFQIGIPPVRVDMAAIDGVAFDEARSERAAARYGDQAIHVISLRHLIANKRATGRARDQLDADDLERARR